MNAYAFILGRNPELSVAEIIAVLPQANVLGSMPSFLVIATPAAIDCAAVLQRLGGTIKVGEVIAQTDFVAAMVQRLTDRQLAGKLKFGVSFYEGPKTELGMEVKRRLAEKNISSRLVVSREKALSSVVVAKNKCQDFLVLQNRWLAAVGAVQEFERYSHLDYGRPERDLLSGSLPPKLAKIMINLARQPLNTRLLDPFCGSGTIVQEALLLGYQDVLGIDKSRKAIDDATKNLEWLQGQQQFSGDWRLTELPVQTLSRQFREIDAIITEPYLGPPLRGGENAQTIAAIIAELTKLYREAFEQFQKVLRPAGRVVIALPYFVWARRGISSQEIAGSLGFIEQQRLRYQRPDQHVARDICVGSFSQ